MNARSNPPWRLCRFLLGLAVSCISLACETSRHDERLLLKTDSKFGTLEVTEVNGIRHLFVDGVLQTAMYAQRSRVMAETNLFANRYWLELLPYFRPEGKRCLLIGLGGGLLTAILEGYGVETHAVEIDPKVVDVARQYFGFTGQSSVCDGRAYLGHSSQRYDFIVIDAFAGATLPYHLATRECFELARKRLAPGGILGLNLVSKPSGSRVSGSVVRTLRAVFPHVAAYRTESSNDVQAIVCFASAAPLQLSLHPHGQELGVTWRQLEEAGQYTVTPSLPGSMELSDRSNPVEQEWSQEAHEWVERMIELFGRR